MSTANTSRTGVIANKIGMTRIYDEFGRSVPVTVLQLDSVQVTAQKTKAKDGYNAVQLGAGKAKKHRVAKAQLAVFAKNNIDWFFDIADGFVGIFHADDVESLPRQSLHERFSIRFMFLNH